MADLPIACSLSSADADTRIEEWRQFLDRQVVEVERAATRARLRLRDRDDALLAATDLARREQACCPFFTFGLRPLPEAVWLEIDVPDDAAGILDELVSLRRI